MPVEWVVGSCCTIIATLCGVIGVLFWQILRSKDGQIEHMQKQQDEFMDALGDSTSQTAAAVVAITAQQQRAVEILGQILVFAQENARQVQETARILAELRGAGSKGSP